MRWRDNDLVASFLSSPIIVVATIIACALIAAALLAPAIAPFNPFDPASNFLSDSLDPPRFIEQYEMVKQATCKGVNGCAKTFMLPQHSHMSEVYSINTEDTRLTDQILEFTKTGK